MPVKSSEITPRHLYLRRREFVAMFAMAVASIAVGLMRPNSGES